MSKEKKFLFRMERPNATWVAVNLGDEYPDVKWFKPDPGQPFPLALDVDERTTGVATNGRKVVIVRQKDTQFDVNVVNHGTLFSFFTLTETARKWADEHVKVNNHMSMGRDGFRCKYRFVADIATGMLSYGLALS